MLHFNPQNRALIVDDTAIIQRTNAVLHAAGIKASVISQKQLIVSAPIIFVKVFEGLYGPNLRGINYSPVSRMDHISNMDIVVAALQSRYHFNALSLVSGELIVDGDQPAIATVIDIFYGHVSSSLRTNEEFQPPPVIPIYETKRQDIIPGELRTIIDRVSYLQGKLDRLEPTHFKKSSGPETNMRTKDKHQKKSKSTSNILLCSRGDMERRCSAEEKVDGRHDISNSEDKLSPSKREGQSKIRPMSASATTRKRGAQEETEGVPEGRVTGAVGVDAGEMFMGKIAFGRCVREERKRKNILNKGEGIKEVDPNYTYDKASGRRVLVGELEALQKQRARLVEKGVIGKTTLTAQPIRTVPELRAMEEKKRMEALRAPVEITEGHFPGHRTEKSVEVFNAKMKSFREPEEVDPLAYLNNPVVHAPFQDLQPLDILVSVEHCHNCEYHCTTLRHKTSEYEYQANEILDHLVGVLHAARPCARVGAVRIPAEITSKSKASDDMSRIGALEVQVAFLGSKGGVQVEVLHSKLKTRQWPGKSVVEKRMHAFLSKQEVQTFNTASSADDYPSLELCAFLPHIIGWVFDAKSIVNTSVLTVDTNVRVYFVPNKWNGTEKYSTEGRVTGVSRNKSTGIELGRVLLRYHKEPIECVATNCRPLTEPDKCPVPDIPELSAEGSASALPKCLQAVLIYAVSNNLTAWQGMSPEDLSLPNLSGGSDFYLCRSSFFHHIHRLAWACINASPGGDGMMLDKSFPEKPTLVDVQLAYSEPVIDWVFSKIGNKVVNMSTLVHLALSAASKEQGSSDDVNRSYHSDKGSGATEHDNIESTRGVKQDAIVPAAIGLNEEDVEERAKAVRHEEKATILRSISHVITSEKEDTSQSTLLKHSSSADVILSLRTRIQNVCLALSSPEGDDVAGAENDADLIASSKFYGGAKKLFDAFDEDSTGELNMKQFNETLVKFGVEVSDNELLKLWASLDIDGNSHISLPELLSFLNFDMQVGYRELGEIWETIRKASGAPPLGIEDDLTGPATVISPVLENMEKDMFSLCDSGKARDNEVSAKMFFQILQKFDVYDHLKAEDVKLLLLYFGVDSVTKRPVKDTVLSDSNVDLMAYNVKFDDFFSWLQPVDFVKVCRRLSRFLKALSKHEGGMGLDGSDVLLAGTHVFDASDDPVSRTIVKHDSIDSDKSISIRINRSEDPPVGKFDFQAERIDANSFSLVIKRMDIDDGWKESVLINWEIIQNEDNVSGIPLSAVDPDRTGRITKARFAAYVDSMGLTITPAELRSLYRNFGSDDGSSMNYASLEQLVQCNYVTHKFVPMIGSRMYRKKSVIVTHDSLSYLNHTPPSTDSHVLHHGLDSLELRIGMIEITGDVLDTEEYSSVMVEVKYLLQDLRVIVDEKFRHGAGNRFVDELDWDAIMLTSSSMKMNADICVALRSSIGNNKTLGKAFFSPSDIIAQAQARDGSHVHTVAIPLANGKAINMSLHIRVRTSGSRLSQMLTRAYEREESLASLSSMPGQSATSANGCNIKITHVTVNNTAVSAIRVVISASAEIIAGNTATLPVPSESTLLVANNIHTCTLCKVKSESVNKCVVELEFEITGLTYEELLGSAVEFAYGKGDRIAVNIRESEHHRRESIRSDTEALEEAEKLVMMTEADEDDMVTDLYGEDYDLSADADDLGTSFLEHFE